MSDELPRKKFHWKRAASRYDIDHTQSLTAGTALVSGSKFKFEHFLRLRVLYVEERTLGALAKYPGFPRARLEEVKEILREDRDAAFVKTFLQSAKDIETRWSVENAEKSGKFAAALELLHLIAKRTVRSMKDSEDISDLKVVASPLKTRNMSQSGADHQRLLFPPTADPAPTQESRQTYGEYSSFNDSEDSLGMSSLLIGSPEEVISQPGTDLRQAIYDFERSNFTPGDEQTVNAALVALIMALSWSLGHTGRVHHDRAKFSIPKDAKIYLYSACVDGLIMCLKEDKCNAFIEVKRDFRAENQSVRRQIAAQMAAFIFEQDFPLAEKETERKTEKAPKGKGRKAVAKDMKDIIKDKDGGKQER